MSLRVVDLNEGELLKKVAPREQMIGAVHEVVVLGEMQNVLRVNDYFS